MLYFLDTSALVKRYHLETGSEIVIQLFNEKDSEIIISSLSLAEFVSAINRVKHRRIITEKDFKATMARFAADISSKEIGIWDVGRAQIFTSYDLIMRHNLTAADGIILATALELRPYNPIFVCADVRSGLLKAAIACHLSTLNPLST